MFSGIITDIGEIESFVISQEGEYKTAILAVKSRYNHSDIVIGSSIANNGICLTVTDVHSKSDDGYRSVIKFQLSEESLNLTNAKNWQERNKINLERSLKMGDEVGGHLVTGHVDGIGEIIYINEYQNNNQILRDLYISCDDEVAAFIAKKGSIALDGISLTVNGVGKIDEIADLVGAAAGKQIGEGSQKSQEGEYKTEQGKKDEGKKANSSYFHFTAISHTISHTNLQYRKLGDVVNVEIDPLARYVARYLSSLQS